MFTVLILQLENLKPTTSTSSYFVNMKGFLVVLLLAVAAHQAYSQTCHMREVDLCMATGMFHFQSNGVPGDDEKVTEWCETMKEVEECMGNFSSKCLSPLQRELTGLLAGSDEEAGQLCTPGSELRANYLQYGECLSEGQDTDEFKEHMRDLQVSIEAMFEAPYKQRFPLMCCAYRRFNVATEAMSARRCGEGSVKMIRRIMRMITSDLPSTICQSFDPAGERCQEILPPPGTAPKGGEKKSQLGKLLDTVFGNQ